MDPAVPESVDTCPATSAADAWLRAVIRGDHRTAWALVDPDLRLAYGQAWIAQALGRTGDDALIRRIVVEHSDEPVWAACVRANGELWHSTHKWWEICGWTAKAETPAPPPSSYTRVALAINQDADAVATGDELPLQHFLMRRRDTWRIAAIGQSVQWSGVDQVGWNWSTNSSCPELPTLAGPPLGLSML